MAVSFRKALKRLQFNDSTLVTLSLRSSSIGDAGAKDLSEALKENSTLVTLYLGSNSIGAAGAKDLSAALKENSTLGTLDLYQNSIGAAGAKDLGAALKENSTLVILDLGNNSIGAAGAKDLGAALKKNSTLVTLDLRSNSIGDAGAKDLGAALKKNCTLVTLNLYTNSIGAEGIDDLSWSMQTTSILINLSDNPGLQSHQYKRFLHATASWAVPKYLPSLVCFFRDLGSYSAAGLLRWLVVLLCAILFVLPAPLLADTSTLPANFTTTAMTTTSTATTTTTITTTTTTITALIRAATTGAHSAESEPLAVVIGTLNQLCDFVPAQTKEEYVDAVSGYGIVVFVSLLLAIWNNRPERFKKACVRLDTSLGQTAGTPSKALTSKDERAFYLLMQLLSVMFSLGHYVAWSKVRPTGSFLCTVAARGTLAVFYKPILPAMWYGFMHLLDDEGWMLHHNILTDTLIAIIILLFSLWFVVAFVFSFPVLVCFFYFGLLLLIPVGIFFFTNLMILAGANDIKKMSTEERAEAAATKILFKRLLGYTVFASLVFSTQLWPLYLGSSYTSLAKQTAENMGLSLSFWKPRWAWSFNWPKDLALPEKLALGISLGFLGLEQLVVGWRWLYWDVLFGPATGSSGWGWRVGRERRSPDEDTALLQICIDAVDKEDDSARDTAIVNPVSTEEEVAERSTALV
jgi:lysophospholipase L1-like esterase